MWAFAGGFDDEAALARAWRTAAPFPHVVIDGLLRSEVAAALEAQFSAVDHKIWKHHLHLHSHRFAGNRFVAMPPRFQAVRGELNEKPILGYLERTSGPRRNP